MTSTRAYGGVPADERRAQRRHTLVETALDLLHEDGLSGISVRSVCARARLTTRYFYESFAELDELLVAAVDSVLDEVAARAVAAAVSGGDTAVQVRAAIDAGYGVVVDDRRKASALLVAAAGYGPLRERRHRLITDYADLIVGSISVFARPGLAGRREARVTAMFLMGGSADVIEAVLAGRLRMSRTRLVDHLTTMWLGVIAGLPGAN